MDPHVTRQAGRITKSANGNINLDSKKSADPSDDKSDNNEDSITNAPISTLSFSNDMTHNQNDAASEYRKMVAAAAYERKQLRASVRATGSDMVSTRSGIASIHATQAAIQTALAKITE